MYESIIIIIIVRITNMLTRRMGLFTTSVKDVSNPISMLCDQLINVRKMFLQTQIKEVSNPISRLCDQLINVRKIRTAVLFCSNNGKGLVEYKDLPHKLL